MIQNMQWGKGSPLASATTFIHKLCLSEVDLIERMAWLYNGTTAIHKLALHETQDPRDSGSAVPAFHWCVRERAGDCEGERKGKLWLYYTF